MAVTLSFDDGYAATWDATLPVLHERGFSATYNAITGCVGGAFEGLPTATWTQWQQAARLGHEVACHSARHDPLAGPSSDLRRLWKSWRCAPDGRAFMRHTAAAAFALAKRRSKAPPEPTCPQLPLDRELAASRSALQRALGRSPIESFAYPSGRHSRHARQAVAAAGFKSARTLDRGWNHATVDFFALRAIGVMPGETLGDLERWFQKARAYGDWLIIVLHLVAPRNPAGYPYFWSVDAFRHLLDRISAQRCWVATQRRVVRYLTQQRTGGAAV